MQIRMCMKCNKLVREVRVAESMGCGCPLCDAHPSMYVTVDEDIAPILLDLNKKGYRTLRSNSGTYLTGYYETGEKFNDLDIFEGYWVDDEPQLCNERYFYIQFHEVPEEILAPLAYCFKIGKWNKHSTQKDTIRMDLEHSSFGEFHKCKMIGISVLIGWAASLPDLNKQE